MENSLRLFIAIELSEKQKEEIALLQEKTKCYLTGVRWVRPEQMHLTLKFLGDTRSEQVTAIKTAMDESTACFKSFQVKYGSCGVFPSPHKARVIWLDLKEGKAEVTDMAKKIEQALSIKGFKPEKRFFKPHLTIGRIRRPVSIDNINQFLKREEYFESTSFNIDSIILFKSRLTGSGAIHISIYRSVLD